MTHEITRTRHVALAAVMLLCTLSLGLHEVRAEPGSFRFAAIADTHIGNGAELAQFRKFVYTIGRDERIDFLLVLGDICAHAPELLPGIAEVMDHAKLVVYPLPGNHDDNYGRNPEWYARAFGRLFYSFEHKGWHFVMNWSQMPPTEWLTADLASVPPETPVVFCQHYPPDRQSDEVQQPWKTVLARSNVKLALAGHLHRFDDSAIDGLRVLTLDNCGFSPQQAESGRYYVFDAGSDGQLQFEAKSVAKLKLLDPPDQAPTITMRTPQSARALSGTAVFEGAASDDVGVQRVEYSVGFGLWRPAKGTERWSFALDTTALPDGHHIVSVRSIDVMGQSSPQQATTLCLVENHTPADGRWLRFQQGVDGYEGCRDVTVRRHAETKSPTGTDGQMDDLETWLWAGGQREFSEFYIRFDLSHSGLPAGAKIKRVRLVLFGSRQNNVDADGKLCRYQVGIVPQPWNQSMTFATRPSQPGWLAEEHPTPAPALQGIWPYLGGRQRIRPPKPVVIDLTPLSDEVQRWLDDPKSNHGLVFSPAFGRGYNMSAKSSRCPIATLRPRLEIEIGSPPGSLK